MNSTAGAAPGPRAATPRTRRVGIYGPRNAGKTCFFGCLYGHREGAGVELTLTDSDTMLYMGGVWATIARGQVPPATVGLPTDLYFQLRCTDAQKPWDVHLKDYPGKLVQPVPSREQAPTFEVRQGVRDWFTACESLLIFVDCAQPDLEQVDALDLLLTVLRQARDRRRLMRPLGLVLTKWDSQGRVSDDFAGERDRAWDLLRGSPVFGQLCRKVEGNTDWFEVFPVSAFGNGARDNRPPPDRLAPCHLHRPLAWACRMADEFLCEQARETAEQHAGRRLTVFGLPLPRPDYGGATAALEGARREHDITEGQTAEVLNREISRLRAARLSACVIAGVVAAALVGGPLFGLGYYGHNRAAERLNDLEAQREAHPGDRGAEERLAADDSFLGFWGSRLAWDARARAREWRAADWRIVEAQRAEAARAEEQRRATRTTMTECARLEREHQLGDAIALYRQFNERYPEAPERLQFEERIQALSPIFEDQRDYEGLCESAGRATVGGLEDAGRLAAAYLDSPRARKQMAAEVRRWRAWFEKFQTQGEYYVRVTSLSIPAGSDLNAFWGTTEPRVVLTLNGASHATRRLRGNQPAVDEELGPFPFRWGDGGALTVRVEGYHPLWSDDAAQDRSADERFALGEAHRSWVIRDKWGKTVTVGLRCPAAVAPALPGYRYP